MPKQKIEIKITTRSSTETFRILHVWKTQDALIVASKLNHEHQIMNYDTSYRYAVAEVEVDQTLPVIHYAIGINESYPKGLLGNYRPTPINRETDIDENKRVHVVYESELSDSDERVKTITQAADEFGTTSLHFFDPENDKVIREKYNDVSFIRDAITKDVHDFREQVILLSSYVKYDHVMGGARKGVLNDAEVKGALANFHLTPEDGVRLTKFNKAYKDKVEAQANKIFLEQAKENNRRHNIKPLNNNSFCSFKNLATFGLFAAGVALAAAVVVNSNLNPRNKI